MTEVLSDFFTHPLPETFNRIKVWAIGRELDDLNAQLLRLRAYRLTTMPRSPIPDDDELTI